MNDQEPILSATLWPKVLFEECCSCQVLTCVRCLFFIPCLGRYLILPDIKLLLILCYLISSISV